MSGSIVYLDNNATTRVDPRVLTAMLPYYETWYGNPSSTHHFGARVAADVEHARTQIARLIGARESEIIFTSGGTEADNTALRGVLAARPSRRHVIVSAAEHHAVLEPAEALAAEGVEVTRLGVDAQGRCDLAALRAALRDDTLLVSIMLANNETGVISPLAEIAAAAREHGALVHTDAVNALGKIPVDVERLGVHLMSLSAHKIYGPKGVGALYVRRGTPFRPVLIGGPQERQRRGGTLNAPAIIGFGVACELLMSGQEQESARIAALRDAFERDLRARIPSAHVIAAEVDRTPNTSCVCFEGVAAEPLLLLLSQAGVCASSGAACSSGSLEPSHVLAAMGVPPEIAQGQVRFSFGRFNTPDEAGRVLELLPAMLEKVAAVNATG